MTGERRSTESAPFVCPTVGKVVKLTIHTVENLAAPAAGRRIERTECDQCQSCGVGERTGDTWTYHWHKCVHPVLKRQG